MGNLKQPLLGDGTAQGSLTAQELRKKWSWYSMWHRKQVGQERDGMRQGEKGKGKPSLICMSDGFAPNI